MSVMSSSSTVASAEALRRDLLNLINSVKGMYAIVITDRDGVALLKASNDFAPEMSMKPTYLASTSITNDQCSKLGLASCKSITCFYENHQVVHFIKHPLLITLIASVTANTGMIQSLENQFDPILNDLKKAISQ